MDELMEPAIQIVIVDDHPMFRDGVVYTLNNADGMSIVGEGANKEDALRLAHELLPDILLLDLNMPGQGLEAIKLISSNYPVIKIVVLTASDQGDDILEALKYGARGYILKGISGPELIQILRDIQQGLSYVPPSLAASLLASNRHGAALNSIPQTELTKREEQILTLVAEGQSNKEIGQKLFIAEKTVKHYMTNILQKLQVRNRVEAVLRHKEWQTK